MFYDFIFCCRLPGSKDLKTTSYCKKSTERCESNEKSFSLFLSSCPKPALWQTKGRWFHFKKWGNLTVKVNKLSPVCP